MDAVDSLLDGGCNAFSHMSSHHAPPPGIGVGARAPARPYLYGLRVDLSAHNAAPEELPVHVLYQYLGGRGLGTYLLLRERACDVEALSAGNPLILTPGPLTGGGAPGAGRYSVSSRSPLTGTVFDGNSGGAFGVRLRRLGLDYLIVTGACSEPTTLVIGGEAVSTRHSGVEVLRPASDGLPRVELHSTPELWGCDVPTTMATLRQRFAQHEAAIIGPAGERGVLFATIPTVAVGRSAVAAWALSWGRND